MLKKRIDLATAVAVFCLALIMVRLWFLQIHHGPEFSKMSEKNRIRVQEIIAPRGNITDRNQRLIITNRPSFTVAWIREDAPNPDEVVKQIAKILGKDVSEILDRIRSAIDQPRYMPIRLAEDIDWKTLVYIENHRFELPGIRIEVMPVRDYLFNDIASHLIGYLGEINRQELETKEYENFTSGDLIGKMGVEKIYEQYLRGEKGQRFVEVDAQGFEQKLLDVQEPLPGNNLELTIDIGMQSVAEQAMADKAGAVVVLEVNTGKVLVLASTPPLKLKEFIGGISNKAWDAMLNDPLHPLLSKTIQGLYPPGSTYKIVTALAALNERVVTPETSVWCPGFYWFGNRRYHCWKKGGHGTVQLRRALTESCDVYFYQAGLKVGVDRLALYANSLGLGVKSGITLEHEKSGLIPTTEWKKRKRQEPWQEGETLSIAIGQGFDLTTPLQVCLMMATTVNGGIIYQPQLLKAIKDPDGNLLKELSPVVTGRFIGSTASLELVKDGLVAVVNEKGGTGSKARLANIKVGGKTGTAQVVKLSRFEHLKDEDIPYEYKDHAWFTCYAPAEKPEIAIAVLVEHGGGGGANAAPIAKKILMEYFNLHPEVTEKPLSR